MWHSPLALASETGIDCRGSRAALTEQFRKKCFWKISNIYEKGSVEGRRAVPFCSGQHSIRRRVTYDDELFPLHFWGGWGLFLTNLRGFNSSHVSLACCPSTGECHCCCCLIYYSMNFDLLESRQIMILLAFIWLDQTQSTFQQRHIDSRESQ